MAFIKLTVKTAITKHLVIAVKIMLPPPFYFLIHGMTDITKKYLIPIKKPGFYPGHTFDIR
jgi:uncharacterized membrane protein YjjP (DUF1212 family)